MESWPFVEAARILESINGEIPAKGYVLFETGYGPSGLPHIGTFAEIVRTSMVRKAFEILAPKIPTRLFAVSDDRDGLRKIPDNVPNAEMLKKYLGMPLNVIPDPFGTHESYAAHMNGRLCAFLDQFNFDYEFKSSAEHYQNGFYDPFLLKILQNYDKVMEIMLPSLGEERQQTYSPFLPICPRTGRVLQVKIVDKNVEKGTISYQDPDTNELTSVPVTGGHCKLQWKPDWGMRWAAFDVNYEMHGKDLTPSTVLSEQITETISDKKPLLYCYELFLDKEGKKISKSKGNGLSVDDWLRYGPVEGLKLFMFQNPRKARKLHFELIPKYTDDYIKLVQDFFAGGAKDMDNPCWHVENGNVKPVCNLNFTLILNLVSVCGATDAELLWTFIQRYDAGIERTDFLERLLGHAIHYYEDFVKPHKVFHAPNEQEKEMLCALADELEANQDLSEDELQTLIFTVGKRFFEKKDLRKWFLFLYQTIFGQESGPKMGSFIKLYGMEEVIDLLKR